MYMLETKEDRLVLLMSANFSILLIGGLGTLLICLLVISPSPPYLSLAVSIPLTRLTILTSLSLATLTTLFSFVSV